MTALFYLDWRKSAVKNGVILRREHDYRII